MSDNITLSDREKRLLPAPAVLVLLLCALLAAILLSFTLGRYPVPLRELIAILVDRLPLVNITQFWEQTQEIAVWNVRMPRVLMAVLVGAALSAAISVARRADMKGKSIAVLLPDGIDRYLSTDIFD